MTRTILAGDIGGTKTLLTVVRVGASMADMQILAEERFESQASATFDDLLERFMRQFGTNHRGVAIQAGCIGVAGPVKGVHAKVTNLPWELNSEALAQRFGIGKIRLINDFQAVGYGIEVLNVDDVCVLQPGQPQERGVRAVIGAGTGLGHGILIWQEDHYEVLGSEAGHTSFAPTDELQLEMLGYLLKTYPAVSYETVCSGPGLETIYGFLQHKHTHQSGSLTAAQITKSAFDRKDPLAQQALEMLIKIYGSQTGNLALTCMATGGVYVAGGIAPKILSALQTGEFMRAFNTKSKMHDLLKTIPVAVVTNTKVGLLGTVAVAAFRM